MKLMISWTLAPQHQKAAVARFLDSGGSPPESVQMLGRWHGPGVGFVLAEASTAEGVYEWLAAWTDLLVFTVTPVVDDEAAGPILARVG